MIQSWQIIYSCFCLATVIQLFYYGYFFTRLAYYIEKPFTGAQNQAVSVIVCARNEAANLTKNLPGALVQKYKGNYEVVVVNDNSVDESSYILEQYRKQFNQLQIVELKEEARMIRGKKYPLSVGIETAKYQVLLLTDADCVPATEFWTEKMQQGYRENIEIVLGYGAYRKKKGFLNKVIRWETFHTALQYLSYSLAGCTYMGVGRNLSYKKSLFLKHKGFSAHYHVASGDDDLFISDAATKKNTAIVIDKDAFTLSEPATRFREWIRQKTRHHTTGRYYKKYQQALLGGYSLSHFLFYPLLIISLLYLPIVMVAPLFVTRVVIQAVIFYRVMHKLGEQDLFKWFIFFDIGMFFYYGMFSFSLFKKPSKSWK